MIQNFKDKGLRQFFETGSTAKLSVPQQSRKIARQLARLDEIEEASEMDVPGWDFHPLRQNRAGEFSVHVNGPWCITFRFEHGDALDVKLENYHNT